MRHIPSPITDVCTVCGAKPIDIFKGKAHPEFCFEEPKPTPEMKSGPVRLVTVKRPRNFP